MIYLSGILALLLSLVLRPTDSGKLIGAGLQPAVATDGAGRVYVVYGRGETIFYVTSLDGETFSAPLRIDSLPGLHIGASRGPQIAATATTVVITAIDKPGNVWAYSLNRSTEHWQPKVRVTDLPDVAKEGFVALTAISDTNYMAVWLDVRANQRNKIVGSMSTNGGRTWSANRVLYESPEGTVCECCQLSVVSQNKRVAIMFRNFLHGARDMYLLTSTDGGRTFGEAQKIGEGTWKLNACPMDGGGLFMASSGTVSTVWRRNDKLFTARPDQAETELGTGKNAKIVSTRQGDYVVFQQTGQIMAILPGQSHPNIVGAGGYAKLALLPDVRVLCVWEQNGAIRVGII